MVRRDNCGGATVKDLLRACEDAVHAALGLTLAFTEKPMTRSLLPRLQEAERAQAEFAFPPDKLMDANALPSYALQKRYLEHFLLKAMQPDAKLIVTLAEPVRRMYVQGSEVSHHDLEF